MTRKIYRTAQGKMVDIGALQLQNENVRAVGNMKVNARGDLVDSYNRPIDPKNAQVSRQYNRQTTNVQSTKVFSDRKSAQVAADQAASDMPQAPEDFEDDFVKVPTASTPKAAVARAAAAKAKAAAEPKAETPSEENAAPSTGLAAAIAKARQVKQEPLKTSKQLAQEKGLNKI